MEEKVCTCGVRNSKETQETLVCRIVLTLRTTSQYWRLRCKYCIRSEFQSHIQSPILSTNDMRCSFTKEAIRQSDEEVAIIPKLLELEACMLCTHKCIRILHRSIFKAATSFFSNSKLISVICDLNQQYQVETTVVSNFLTYSLYFRSL